MKKPDLWMPLYIADFICDTVHLNDAETGAYLLLICHAWRNGGAIPDDEAQLKRICRSSSESWSAIKATVLAFFFKVDGGYRHKRVDSELEIAKRNTAARSSSGKIGAAKRWQTHSKRIANRCQNDRPSPTPIEDSASDSVEASTQPTALLRVLPPQQNLQVVEPSDSAAKAAPKRGGRLPVDWQPSLEDERFAVTRGLNPVEVAASFRDFWHAKAGKDATKMDWSATWRNWCRREAERRCAPKHRDDLRAAERDNNIRRINELLRGDAPDFFNGTTIEGTKH